MRKTSDSIKNRSKIGLGLALVALGIILVFGGKKGLPESTYTFANEPVRIEGFIKQELEEKKLPKRVIIPGLSIDLEVGRSEIIAGYWEVFENKAGWGVGSGIPGGAGNQVVFAHAREGLFLPLRNIQKEMKVYILTDDVWYLYKVEDIKEVFPNQTEVIAPTEDETLTLYTCSGFNDTMRLIVTAKRE